MAQYKDITIPSGSTFSNATIKGNGTVSFKDSPKNQFDIGMRSAPSGSYKITSVVDRSKEDNAQFAKSMTISGYSVKIGTVVNIQLTNNVTATIPTEAIVMTNNGNSSTNTTPSNNEPNKTTTKTKPIFTIKNVIIGIVIFGAIFGLLKYKSPKLS